MTAPYAITLSGPDQKICDAVADHLVLNYDYEPLRLGQSVDDLLLALSPHIPGVEEGGLFGAVYSLGWDEAEENYPEIGRLRRSLRALLPRYHYPEILVDNVTSQTHTFGGRHLFPDVHTDAETSAITNWFGAEHTHTLYVAPPGHRIEDGPHTHTLRLDEGDTPAEVAELYASLTGLRRVHA